MKVIDVAHVSAKGTSHRIAIPRKVVAKMGIKDEDILVFYDDNGKIVIKPFV